MAIDYSKGDAFCSACPTEYTGPTFIPVPKRNVADISFSAGGNHWTSIRLCGDCQRELLALLQQEVSRFRG